MSKTSHSQITPVELIERRIHVIRNQKVILDSDPAELYNVMTKNLNKAVQRNIERFPVDFMFQLTGQEVKNLRFQFGTSSSAHGGKRYLPRAFTEQGVAMLSSVLNRAVKVVETPDELERRVEDHDEAIFCIRKTMRELVRPIRTNAISPMANVGSNPLRGLI